MAAKTSNARPILFSTPMVRAILDERKTMTRRVVKLPVIDPNFGCELAGCEIGTQAETLCPYGPVGAKLWVRETFQFVHANYDGQRNTFTSDTPFTQNDYWWIEYAATPRDEEPPKWKPSIYMPRWASRITLEVAAVRVERLQAITESDANAEGFPSHLDVMTLTPARSDFAALWDSINKKRGFGWDVNPYVWVVSFKRV